MKSTKKLAFSTLLILFLPLLSHAQQLELDIPFAFSNELKIELTPNYIRPYENATINLYLYTANLDAADIAWFRDGKQVQVGHGLTSYSFVAGAAGESANISVRIRLSDGTVFGKDLNITPSSVDLLWEAQSYTPPFYRGKALHPVQGVLKVVAMPEFVVNGKRIDPSNLIYNWSNGVESYSSQSGYGRNVLVINGSLLGITENVEVVVTDPKNNLVAENFIDIRAVEPELTFYEYSPYYGHIFDTALPLITTMESEETQIMASPYFFSDANRLNYAWKLNNQVAPDLVGFRTVVFRKPEDESGRSLVSLQITNPLRILQAASKNLNLEFAE